MYWAVCQMSLVYFIPICDISLSLYIYIYIYIHIYISLQSDLRSMKTLCLDPHWMIDCYYLWWYNILRGLIRVVYSQQTMQNAVVSFLDNVFMGFRVFKQNNGWNIAPSPAIQELNKKVPKSMNSQEKYFWVQIRKASIDYGAGITNYSHPKLWYPNISMVV